MPKSQPDPLGAAVRDALRERHITQTAAGSRLGLSQPAMSRRLAGEVPWRDHELRGLAELLGITPAQLLEPPALLVDDDEATS